MFAAYPKSVAGPVEQKGGPCGRIVLRARLERPRRAGQERGQVDKVLGSSRGRRDSLLGRGRDGLMIEVWDREEPSDPGAADRLTGGGLQQQPELHGEQPRDSIRALSTIPRCRLARSCADGERWTARALVAARPTHATCLAARGTKLFSLGRGQLETISRRFLQALCLRADDPY